MHTNDNEGFYGRMFTQFFVSETFDFSPNFVNKIIPIGLGNVSIPTEKKHRLALKISH